jgi:thioredoxin 1
MGAKVLTDATFDEEINASQTPVLVDCWASWCGPCRMVAPILEELAGEYEGRMTIAKLSVEENTEVPARFEVSAIPTMLVFVGGELKDRIVGALNKQQLTEKIEALLAE